MSLWYSCMPKTSGITMTVAYLPAFLGAAHVQAAGRGDDRGLRNDRSGREGEARCEARGDEAAPRERHFRQETLEMRVVELGAVVHSSSFLECAGVWETRL